MNEGTVQPAPLIRDEAAVQVAEGVHVIPDGRVPLVPNVGFVVGETGLLVVDTGMGPANGERVLREARERAAGRRIFLTLTHFHAEHGYGAQVFRDDAVILYNAAQASELVERGPGMRDMFAARDERLADLLREVEFVPPHVTYDGKATIDLGGIHAELIEIGHAHTLSDQVVHVPERGVLFAGDLFEYRFFPIVPTPDVHIGNWMAALERLEAMKPSVVVPGHGETTGASALLEPRDYFARVRDSVATQRGAGLSLEEAQDALEDEIKSEWSHWEAPAWVRNTIGNVYAELGA